MFHTVLRTEEGMGSGKRTELSGPFGFPAAGVVVSDFPCASLKKGLFEAVPMGFRHINGKIKAFHAKNLRMQI
jgi:hypothetical protein